MPHNALRGGRAGGEEEAGSEPGAAPGGEEEAGSEPGAALARGPAAP